MVGYRDGVFIFGVGCFGGQTAGINAISVCRRYDRGTGKRTRESGRQDREGEDGNIVLLRETQGGRCSGEGGAERTVQVNERDLEVDGVIWGGGFDDVVFEN